MTRWLYIETREIGNGSPSGDSPVLSFHHVEVLASNEEEAYALGFGACKQLKASATEQSDPSGHFRSGGGVVNDYVINLGELPMNVQVLTSRYWDGTGFDVVRAYAREDRARFDLSLMGDGKEHRLHVVRLVCGDTK